MVEYNCLLCSYKTTFTTNYNKHLKSKKHLAKEKEIANGKTQIESKLNPIESKLNPNESKLNPNESFKKFICNFCNKEYSTNSNLHKHLKKCSIIKKDHNNNLLFDTPFCTQNALFCTQNAPFCTQYEIDDNREGNVKKIIDNKTCKYCNKTFTRTTGLKKHLQTCKLKKDNISKIKEENDLELMKKEIIELKENNKNLTVNNQLTKINTQNNGTINYLNLHFNNVQPMEQFIENFKNKCKLSDIDRKMLLNTYNECDIGLFSDTFFHMMKKYLLKQIDADILPTIPMVCTDSNLRSIKEYHKDTGWKTTQSHKCIDEMIDISNRQIFETENTMMCFDQKQRNKIYSRMKQENSLLSMEEDKEKYEEKKNSSDQLIANKDKNEKKKVSEKINSKKEMDFSIINDELIEKYSLPNAPKLIT